MQEQLAAEGLPVEIRILGINAPGLEAGNAAMTANVDLPWLQDTGTELATARWNAAFRDVFVLDETNRPVRVYNLTDHSLGDPANFAELMGILRERAGG